ncbi:MULTISPECIES: NAD-dependent epimerase/dehydratase family protein [Paenibacillus]|uniref:NAD-dependent epimerase/dehydratase family protein n=1 Tax=Paenibacillus TaxID=44249 RepID=UPI00048A6956|nr:MULTISPECIES: NAD(P)-dependent oxidoreductase [Paenibacillus]APB75036.1 NAD(P)-dependent oxidoreductase [Paenibacillus polymyxa]OMF78389.1 NAD-dependent epimerase [Paenibacillus peoriae]POR26050.1 NAD(P)-dependent oxidoreductase [Paenibacillus polymyxa]SFR09128.1 uronate dehydrogenase [Paenibacillus sp. cl130]
MARKLLITGAAGTIGKVLYEGLKAEGKYEIIAADVKRDEEAGIVEMDIHDAARLAELTRGVDTVLHFAWIKDEGDFLGKVLSGNVSGAYKLYEAAVKNGVKRIVFASSNHATGFYKVGESIDVEDPYRPDSFYGLSKCYIELLGRLYADQGKISSMNIRIGNFPGDDRPHSERAAHIWISDRDMIRLTVCCIEARPEMSYLNLYGTSANTDNYYDIGYLEEQIGYKPQDNAAELLEQAKKIGFWVKQDETTFQGGQKE